MRKATFEEAKELENCCLIYEDIINPKQTDLMIMKHTLLFSGHHRNVDPQIVIAHGVFHNKVFSILDHFKKIIITDAKGNIGILSRILTHFKFSKEEKKDYSTLFRQNNQKFSYFIIDLDERRVYRNAQENLHLLPNDQVLADAKNSAEKILSLADQPERAKTLFNIIVQYIPPSALSPVDLSVWFRRTSKKKTERISLIEYINCLLTKRDKPNKEIMKLHSFITKRCLIPKFLILNKHFRS